MGTYTVNYNLFLPTVGEQGWGELVNGNFTTIDTTMKSLSNRIGTLEPLSVIQVDSSNNNVTFPAKVSAIGGFVFDTIVIPKAYTTAGIGTVSWASANGTGSAGNQVSFTLSVSCIARAGYHINDVNDINDVITVKIEGFNALNGYQFLYDVYTNDVRVGSIITSRDTSTVSVTFKPLASNSFRFVFIKTVYGNTSDNVRFTVNAGEMTLY